MRQSIITGRRAVFVSLVMAVVAIVLAPAASATPLTPFIDLQEQGLTADQDGVGLKHLGSGTETLTVNVGGTVRFALLYWAGRDRPAPTSGGNCVIPSQPYKDQQMVFNGNSLTGFIIGTECQVTTSRGPVNNIGYFADVTSLVSAAGPGSHAFTIADGDLASNLWTLDGATLFVAYTNAADPITYRLLVQDGLDFARANAATPGDNRTTNPVTFNHGASTSARSAELFLSVGNASVRKDDNVTISNNPTLFNQLDRDDGPAWDADVFTIGIPASVASTTVQVNSGPTRPDVLLWQMAALRVPIVP
jgi:Protein of unknown function (DUF3344)